MTDLRLDFASVEELRASYQSDLRKGRAFVVGAVGFEERQPCGIVIAHPGHGGTFVARAEVVWVKREGNGIGVGIQFCDFDEAARARLLAFVESQSALPADGGKSQDENQQERPADDAIPKTLHDRIRTLSLREREVMARQGTLPERVALERCFGGSVWEALLQNAQLSPGEAARIAKSGSLPKHLVQIIVSNGTWLANPEVQRALLLNPRVSGPHIERVLRAMPRSELTRIVSTSAYRSDVRSAARKILGIV